MRLHIELDDDLVAALDDLAGPRGRSGFIRRAIEAAIDHHQRAERIRAARGTIGDDHDWDTDVAGWVRHQRRADRRKVG